MFHPETVRVKHADGYAVINKSDFIPGTHELFDAAELVEAPPQELSIAGLKAAIAEVGTLEELAIYIEAEEGRKDGARKGALAALTERYEAIEAAAAAKGSAG